MTYEETILAFGKIAKCIIGAAGMQAENMCMQKLGSQSLPYSEAPFYELCNQIDKILGDIK